MNRRLAANASFLNTLLLDLKRAVFSLRFLAGIVFLLIWMFLNEGDSFFNNTHAWEAGIVSLLSIALGGYNMGPLLLVIATIPFSTTYLTEKECGFQAELEKRTGIYQYSVSKAVCTGISAFLLAIVSVLLFILLLMCLKIPHIHPYTLTVYYGELCNTMGVWWFYAVKMIIAGLACGVAGMFALFISSYVSNAYAAILSPMIGYYLWDCVLDIAYPLLPSLSGSIVWRMFSPINLLFGEVWLGNSLSSFLWTACFLLALTACFGIQFVKRLCREVGK